MDAIPPEVTFNSVVKQSNG